MHKRFNEFIVDLNKRAVKRKFELGRLYLKKKKFHTV